MLIKIGDCWVDPNEIAAIFPTADLPSTPKVGITLRSGGSTWVEATMDEAEAALIDAGVIEDPAADAPPELTEEECAELQDFYDQGFEYLARDADGRLFAYKGKPGREGGYFYAIGSTQPVAVGGAFTFIDSADDPWSIPFLLLD